MSAPDKIPLGILAKDRLFQFPQNLAPLEPYYDIIDLSDWPSYDELTLLQRCRSVEVLVTGRESTGLPHGLVTNFGRLRYLCHLYGSLSGLVGQSHLDAGLLVTNWGDHVESIAEGAMALLLCQLKQVVTLDAHLKGNSDARIYQAYLPHLRGLNVGLYGFGPIGRHMARLFEAFGPILHVFDPHASELPPSINRCASLHELFSRCEIISIHCGLNAATEYSVSDDLLMLLPQGGIVINTARGRIIDEEALAAHVAAGHLLAGCDVISDETDWQHSPLSPLAGSVLTGHQIGGGKGYPPGSEPFPTFPEYAVHNLLAYARHEPMSGIVNARELPFKT